MYNKCLTLQIAHYGENNFNLANTYINIGAVYYSQGKLQEALEMFNKCLTIQTAHYGEKNFNLASIYMNIGSVYYSQGKL